MSVMKHPGKSIRNRSTLRLEALEDRQLLSFTVTDLGSFGGSKSTAFGINELGHVVGKADMPNSNQHAFYWNPLANPQLKDLGTLGGNQASAFGINESGVIAGFAQKPDPTQQEPTLWSPPTYTPPQGLGTFGGPKGNAFGVNDNGVAVGQAQFQTIPFITHAFVYQNGTLTDLGTLQGGTFSSAQGINNAGQIVGFAAPSGNSPQHAFLYENGTMKDLGTLGGTESKGYAINSKGHIAGSSKIASGELRPILHVRNQMKDLGTLGGLEGEAFAVNDLTQVVGRSFTAGGLDHAFLWKGGYMYDLNTLFSGSDWVFKEARGINNKGQIVGVGTSPNLEEHAFLITPDERSFGSSQRALSTLATSAPKIPERATPTVTRILAGPQQRAMPDTNELSPKSENRAEVLPAFRAEVGRLTSAPAIDLQINVGDPLR